MLNRPWMNWAGCALGVAMAGEVVGAERPNLIIIHTDEHNFRTLGCYRELMTPDQAYVWGDGVKVDTPHIDSLARDGALGTSYYVASPVCTPSRASLVSGLYPIATGAPVNNLPMHDHVVTFAEVLRRHGYATSYVGKWHLDGDERPGFAPARKFGFEDNRYMWNRGHWKLLEDTAEGLAIIGDYNPVTGRYQFDISHATEENFSTDFLTTRVLEIIERDKDGPFCIMLSIPDPHGPNHVRSPYDTLFDHFFFQNPRTMDYRGPRPAWGMRGGRNELEELNQERMRWYFGMVKCIDDNVGRILDLLEEQGLAENTIVVFTADHGDLKGEHGRLNKGVPYEASARVPFIVRWPAAISGGKLIHTAHTTVDFKPTFLSMMGFSGSWEELHGEDRSGDFLGPDDVVHADRVVYFTDAGRSWVAAVDDRYKLILSPIETPWLFDVQRDPDELINFFDDPEYASVVERLMAELKDQMERFEDPVLAAGRLIYDSSVDPAEIATSPSSVGWSQEPVFSLRTGDGWLLDERNLAVDATGRRAGQWARAFAVPSSNFEPNQTYELIVEWTSGGLSSEGDFFINFIGDRQDRDRRQLTTWMGEEGESGRIEVDLVTDDQGDWSLFTGVRGGGTLTIDRVRIRRK